MEAANTNSSASGSAREWPSQINRGNLKLHVTRWQSKTQPKAILLLLHGMGEHAGRYEDFAAELNKNDITVIGIDHEGHGRSGGDRGFFADWKLVVGDIEGLIDLINVHYPKTIPRFLFGHSMGGGLAIQTGLRRAKEFKGIIVSSPLIEKGADITNTTIMLVKVMNWIAPRMGAQDIDPQHISSIQAEVDKYKADPLNFHGKIPVGTGAALLDMMDHARNTIELVDWPFLFLQADEDTLVDPRATRAYHDRVKSADKTFITYKGKHEIHNDVDREKELKDILDWITKRW